jgi:glycosyltransferase involved in cell wall biosynthesis
MLFRRALALVDVVIAVSKKTKEIFLDYYPDPKSSLVIIHNSIQNPNPKTDQIKEKNIINCYVVVTIGAVKRRKGIHKSILFLSNWAKNNASNICYYVAGYSDEKSEYVREVKSMARDFSHGAFEVKFLGMIDDDQKIHLLSNSDLYIHLEDVDEKQSDVEGFGIGIIEAAGYGVPAIVAKGSATSEAVDVGVSGYIVDLKNDDTVYQAISNVLIEKNIKSSNAKKWAYVHSSEQKYKEIEKLYNHKSLLD